MAAARRPSPKPYREDLAFVHDVGFGAFAREAAPGVLEILAAAGVRSGRVVDLGCGSGIWAERLVERGYEVLGIDISEAMIRRARRRVPEAQFRIGSLFRAEIPRCAAVTALGECISYRFEPGRGGHVLPRLFRRVHAALAPGGVRSYGALPLPRARAGFVARKPGSKLAR